MQQSLLEELLCSGKAITQKIPPEQLLFSLGDACEHYVVVQNGTVRVELLAASGQQLLLYRIEAGQSCVMTTSCLLGGSDYFAQAVSESDVDLILVPQSVFQKQLTESIEFRDFVFNGFAERLASMLGRTAELATSTVDQRLAGVLVTNAEKNSSGVTLALTHNQLAIEIGTAREVVSRRLAAFEKKELIERHRGLIKLLDTEKLTQLSSIL